MDQDPQDAYATHDPLLMGHTEGFNRNELDARKLLVGRVPTSNRTTQTCHPSNFSPFTGASMSERRKYLEARFQMLPRIIRVLLLIPFSFIICLLASDETEVQE